MLRIAYVSRSCCGVGRSQLYRIRQLLRKLFLTKLSRMRFWNIVDFKWKFQCLYGKINLLKCYPHIVKLVFCVDLVTQTIDHNNVATSQPMHRFSSMHRVTFRSTQMPFKHYNPLDQTNYPTVGSRHGVPCFATSQSRTGYAVGFDHGLPCRVKNMARGTQ